MKTDLKNQTRLLKRLLKAEIPQINLSVEAFLYLNHINLWFSTKAKIRDVKTANLALSRIMGIVIKQDGIYECLPDLLNKKLIKEIDLAI